MAIPLGRPLPGASRDLPGRPARKPACPRQGGRRPYLVLLPVGFAVPSPSPAPRCALTAPFHPCTQASRAEPDACPGERYALCGTFPGVTPAGRYPAPCFRGARTFLPRANTRRRGSGAAIRPPDPGLNVAPIDHGFKPPWPSQRSASRPSSRASVARSATPSTHSGRKCRWKAVITSSVARSSRPCRGTA